MFKEWFKELFINRPITTKEIDEIIEKAVRPFKERDDATYWIQSMQKLEIKEGDILVIKYPGILSAHACDALKSRFKEIMADFTNLNLHVMLLEGGMDIGIIMKGEN